MEELPPTIEGFFRRHGGASLRLPTGWFGRPYDNHHALTRVCLEADDELLIVLDNTHELRLAGPMRAAVNRRELRLDGFSRGSWSWTEYGSDRRDVVLLPPGEIHFFG